MKKILIALALTVATAGSALAHDYTIGDLTINHPVARATPVNAPVSAGYMTITNNGSEDDRLVSAKVGFAGTVELHEMTMDGDVMKMREMEGGIVIPAGQSVQLKPGGLHVMFMDMQQMLNEGEEHAATLTFEKAGSIDVTLNVETLADIRKSMGGEGMQGHGMQGHGMDGHKMDGNGTMKMDHSNHGTDG